MVEPTTLVYEALANEVTETFYAALDLGNDHSFGSDGCGHRFVSTD